MYIYLIWKKFKANKFCGYRKCRYIGSVREKNRKNEH